MKNLKNNTFLAFLYRIVFLTIFSIIPRCFSQVYDSVKGWKLVPMVCFLISVYASYWCQNTRSNYAFWNSISTSIWLLMPLSFLTLPNNTSTSPYQSLLRSLMQMLNPHSCVDENQVEERGVMGMNYAAALTHKAIYIWYSCGCNYEMNLIDP